MDCQLHCSQNTACVHRVPIFQGMEPSELDAVQAVTRSKSFHKGEYVFQEGDYSDTLYIVNEGLIKILKLSDEGKEQIVRLLFPGDFFGEFALLQNKNHYVSAKVMEDTTVCTIQKAEFLSTLEQSPKMSYRLILALNQLLHQADEWMSMLSLMEIEQRLARVLLLFNKKMQLKNGKFTFPVPKKDIASLIGTTPETLSRKLLTFSNQGAIRLDGRKGMEIVNLDQLKEIAHMWD